MSTRKTLWSLFALLLVLWSSPSLASHVDARTGLVTSFQGQSLALEHRLKPKVSLEFHREWSPGVALGVEVMTHPDPSPHYLLLGGLGTLRLSMISTDSAQWNLVFGAGVGNGPDILYDNLDGRTAWSLLVQGGTEWRLSITNGFDWTFRILSENLLMASVESGFSIVF